MPGSLRAVGDLFDGYGASARGLTEAAFDEMVGRDGTARVPYAAVASSLAQMGPEDVSARASRLARAFMDQGVTFDLDGEERPFPLDVVPRIFTGAEWSKVAAGLVQRVRALELFLADVYGAARIVSDGLIPHEVITSSPGFVRAAYGYSPPNGVRIHVAGIDVIRDEDGEFRVLEDNLRSPSGVSYVLANRAAMARVLPELFWGQPIQMVTDYPARLINALRRAAPASVQDPTVVVLTPGVHNSAFYEHALLARLMGVHLVEGRDLVCHGTDVFLRTTEGEVPVHVIYRRIDDEYPRPAAVPSRVAGGLSGHRQRGAGGSGDDRQRAGERRGRRQARVHLRAGHDPLLPGRGPDPAERRDDAPRGQRRPQGRALPPQ